MFPEPCHSEERSDEESPTMEGCFGREETLLYAQSDRHHDLENCLPVKKLQPAFKSFHLAGAIGCDFPQNYRD